jgi:hypothetical protein
LLQVAVEAGGFKERLVRWAEASEHIERPQLERPHRRGVEAPAGEGPRREV